MILSDRIAALRARLDVEEDPGERDRIEADLSEAIGFALTGAAEPRVDFDDNDLRP